MREPTYFDDFNKRELEQIFSNTKTEYQRLHDERPTLEDIKIGVKLIDGVRKNQNSVADYNILSNLSTDELALGLAYDGVTKHSDIIKTTN